MKVQIEEKEYQIIESLGDLPLGKYIQFKNLENKFKNEEINDTEFNTLVIELLLNISKEKIYELDLPSFQILFDYVANLLNEKLPEKYENREIEIDGTKFLFDTNFYKISYGMYWDLLGLLKRDFYEAAPLIAATLIRPIDENGKISKYNVEQVDENISLMADRLLMKDFNPVSVFFLIFSNELLNGTLTSSLPMKTKAQKKME
jgi:hypothetical protein